MSIKKKILITDDDPGVQDSFRMILERAGYAVEVFTDGARLLTGDFEIPDLFVLDTQLSGIDGLDICRHLKSNDETRHIPLIMLSATPHIDRLAISAGADGFIEKPFKMQHLLDTVARQFDGPDRPSAA